MLQNQGNSTQSRHSVFMCIHMLINTVRRPVSLNGFGLVKETSKSKEILYPPDKCIIMNIIMNKMCSIDHDQSKFNVQHSKLLL